VKSVTQYLVDRQGAPQKRLRPHFLRKQKEGGNQLKKVAMRKLHYRRRKRTHREGGDVKGGPLDGSMGKSGHKKLKHKFELPRQRGEWKKPARAPSCLAQRKKKAADHWKSRISEKNTKGPTNQQRERMRGAERQRVQRSPLKG